MDIREENGILYMLKENQHTTGTDGSMLSYNLFVTALTTECM